MKNKNWKRFSENFVHYSPMTNSESTIDVTLLYYTGRFRKKIKGKKERAIIFFFQIHYKIN